ncbi:MAG: twin-arginine translocation protein, TatB subunit [Magnetococcales bacterium]|nr:twin-arginine translocation protein, TatB subunit [Magnetococcales bacterium]HIJ83358.1 hypothetical protein [Magnetococcales bacterium]
MLGLGWLEIFVVVVVALLVIGPESLPEVARTLARMLRQLQRIVAEVRNSVNLEELERPLPKPPAYPAAPVLPWVGDALDDHHGSNPGSGSAPAGSSASVPPKPDDNKPDTTSKP